MTGGHDRSGEAPTATVLAFPQLLQPDAEQPEWDKLRGELDRPTRHIAVGECRTSWRALLADDWRGFLGEVRGSPFSHALVAILAFAGGCAGTVGLAFVWSLFL